MVPKDGMFGHPTRDSLARVALIRQSRFPCITFCEGLVPDAEPPFLKLATVEVPNEHPKTFSRSSRAPSAR